MPGPASSPRVALIHDFLLDVRGGERVFLELCGMWPEAEIFTAVYDESGTEGRFSHRRVHPSFLQALRPTAQTFRALLPLYPAAVESFDLSGFELVVSSSSAWAHGVLCGPGQVHVSYCHNPFRYAWNDRERTLASRRNPLVRAFLRGAFVRWRSWDQKAAQRTDRYVANSRMTQARIRAYFGRDAAVVYPPVDTGRFHPGVVDDHYVIVSELMAHKQIDLAIEAFNRLRLPLIVVGDGPDQRRLQALAGPTVRLAGRLPDRTVVELLRSARALVITSVEEFGMVAVEAQAAGRPVLARRGGGALETVIDGVTGSFWAGGPRELATAILNFDDQAIDPEACTRNAKRFDVAAFRRGMFAEVREACSAAPRPATSKRRPLPSTRLVKFAIKDASR